MNANKIVNWVAAAIAIVGAFVPIPAEGLLLLLAGLYIGLSLQMDETVRVGVGAVILAHFSGNVDVIPYAGTYLHAILGSVGALMAGAALMRVSLNVWARVKP
jgi:hypothetical protein